MVLHVGTFHAKCSKWRVGRINGGLQLTCLSQQCIPRQSTVNLVSPFHWTRVTGVTQTLGPTSTLFPACHFSHFPPSVVLRFLSAFYPQPAFYSQCAVCILHSVCILPLVRSPQSAFWTDRIVNWWDSQCSLVLILLFALFITKVMIGFQL